MLLFSVAIAQDGQKFHAQVPDLPNINVIGESIADTIDKVRHVIIERLQFIANNNDIIHEPKNISSYLTDPRFAGRTWAIVSLDVGMFVNQIKPIVINVPRRLLEQLSQKLDLSDTLESTESQARIEEFILVATEKWLERQE